MIAFVHDTAAVEGPPSAAVLGACLRWLDRQGVTRAVVAGALPDGLEHAIAELTLEVDVVAAGPGAANALRAAAERAPERAWVVVDLGLWRGFDLAALLREHAASPAIATLALWRGDSGGRRVEVDRSGRVLRIAAADPDRILPLASIGCSVVEADLLVHVPDDRAWDVEPELFGLVLAKGGILSAVEVGADEPSPARSAAPQLAH